MCYFWGSFNGSGQIFFLQTHAWSEISLSKELSPSFWLWLGMSVLAQINHVQVGLPFFPFSLLRGTAAMLHLPVPHETPRWTFITDRAWITNSLCKGKTSRYHWWWQPNTSQRPWWHLILFTVVLMSPFSLTRIRLFAQTNCCSFTDSWDTAPGCALPQSLTALWYLRESHFITVHRGGNALCPKAGNSDSCLPTLAYGMMSPACWPMPCCPQPPCPRMARDPQLPISWPEDHCNHGDWPSYSHHGNTQRCSGWQCSSTGGVARWLSPADGVKQEHDPNPKTTSKCQASSAVEMQKNHTLRSSPCATAIFPK